MLSIYILHPVHPCISLSCNKYNLRQPTNQPTSVASQLSWLERRTGIARSRVQAPFKSWIFFRLLYAIANNCVHNCEDQPSFEVLKCYWPNIDQLVPWLTVSMTGVQAQYRGAWKQRVTQENHAEPWQWC